MRLGIALGGGAGLGWAHIGVLRVFETEGVDIDVISGTSIGAIVGACAAADMLDELEELARDVGYKDMFMMSEFGFKQGGLIGAGKIERKMREYFGIKTIEQLQKPFAAVAVDIFTGEQIDLDSGDVVTAVRASSAIPGVLPPIETGHMMLVDGGLVDPVPVRAARNLGADFVVGVDLQNDYENRVRSYGLEPGGPNKRAAFKTARAGAALLLKTLGKLRMGIDKPELVIAPNIGHIEVADFTKADDLIALGKKAAYDVLPDLEHMLKNAEKAS